MERIGSRAWVSIQRTTPRMVWPPRAAAYRWGARAFLAWVCQARLDEGYYPTGVKVSDKQLAALAITKHKFHGEWNYTLKPEAVVE